jgi:hypothetical protein
MRTMALIMKKLAASPVKAERALATSRMITGDCGTWQETEASRPVFAPHGLG